MNPIQKIPGVLRTARTSGEGIEPHSQSNNQPRLQNLSPTQHLIAPRLTERTITPLSPDAPRLQASSSSSSTSVSFKKSTFKSIPDHLLPLIASFCNKPMQTLAATWIANFDNHARPITPALPESLVIDILHLDGMQIAHLPMAKRSLAVCRTALRQNALAWIHIPRYLRNSHQLNLVEIAVGVNGMVLRHLRPEQLNQNQRETAVANNALAMAFIPMSQQSPSMYQSLLGQATHNSHLIQMVQTKDRTLAMYELAILENTLALEHVPVSMRSYSMYRNAVRHTGWNLRLVPMSMRDLRMCIQALRVSPQAIEFVPIALKAKPLLWRAAIAIGAKVLMDVPEVLCLDGEVYKQALSIDGTNLRFIPPNQRTPDMCELAVTQNGYALRYVPVNLKTSDLVQKAVTQNGMAIGSLPVELRAKLPSQLIDAGLSSNPIALKFVPPHLRSMKRCLDAVRLKPGCIKFVPAIHLLNSEELQEIAFSQYRDRLPSGWDIHDAQDNRPAHDKFSTSSSTSSSSSSSTSTSTSSLSELRSDRKSDHRTLPLQASPLMMEHLVELNNGANFNLSINMLYQGIPKEWIFDAQDCWNFMLDCSFGIYKVSEVKIYPQDHLNFELKKTTGQKSSKITNIYPYKAAVLMPAIGRNPTCLRMVPEQSKTTELCMLAVRRNGLTIAYVPPHLRDEAMCLAAFASAGHAALPFIRRDLYEQLR